MEQKIESRPYIPHCGICGSEIKYVEKYWTDTDGFGGLKAMRFCSNEACNTEYPLEEEADDK